MSKSYYVRSLALGAILASMAAILKFLSIETTFSRLTFYDIPTMFGGIILGPIWGGMIGLAADLSKISIYGPGLMTVSSMLWGFIPGLIFFIYYMITKSFKLNYILLGFSIVLTSIICFSINTYHLQLYYGWVDTLAKLPLRIVVLVVKWPIQFGFIAVIHHNIKHLLPTFREHGSNEHTSFEFE